jgi:hypothetical protein
LKISLKAPFEDHRPKAFLLLLFIPESLWIDRRVRVWRRLGTGRSRSAAAAATASVHSGEEKRGGVIRTATDDCAHDAILEAGTERLLLLGPCSQGDSLTHDSIDSQTITWRLQTWNIQKRPTVSQHHSHHTLMKVRVQSHKISTHSNSLIFEISKILGIFFEN